MASRTIVKGDSGVPGVCGAFARRRVRILDCGVAPGARRLAVAAGQRIPGRGVLETGGGDPPVLRVAIDTLRGQLFAVLIVVATQALPVEPQKGAVHVDLITVRLHVIPDKFCFVTIAAFQTGVFALESVLRFAMVKVVYAFGCKISR